MRFNQCSTCTDASTAVAGGALSTSTLLCTSGCCKYWHHRWPSNPTALSTRRSLFRAARPSSGDNTVNTWGDRQHDRRADIASCIHFIMVMSTHHGSDPFAGGGNTLVAAAVLLSAVWCSVGKYYVGKKPTLTVFMTGWYRRCTSRTFILDVVNFKQLHVRRRADWLGGSGTGLSFTVML